MLVANLSKHESLQRLLTTEIPTAKALTSHSPAAVQDVSNQILQSMLVAARAS